MGARRNRTAAPERDPRIERIDYEYMGIQKDDPCLIDGDRDGRYIFRRREVWKNGVDFCVLWGGMRGHAQERTPGTDRVLPDPGRSRAPQASLSGTEANQPPTTLEARRRKLGWSRNDLAAKAGVAPGAISTLERGGNPQDGAAAGKVWQAVIEAEGGGGRTLYDTIIMEKLGFDPREVDPNDDDEDDDDW